MITQRGLQASRPALATFGEQLTDFLVFSTKEVLLPVVKEEVRAELLAAGRESRGWKVAGLLLIGYSLKKLADN